MKEMLLKNLYGVLIKEPNSPQAFIANVIYERYGKDRKKMLQGLYNIMNGGNRHYWAPCDVRFADWSMETIICTPLCNDTEEPCPLRHHEKNNNVVDVAPHSQKEVDIHNLPFYA